ncbi:acyltransferase family protein [Chitinophaga vietnamensis]|uniref:acyltransferase family protein n=1 Tax=Chitinophaga vietnamensis TaxID=2593957 RepID=UPI0013763F76|nr:acyltransferase family protein [Chitinophaga vietnamensis]
MQATSSSRQAYLDWLRILAILGVLVFHSARPFMADDPWHVNNASGSAVLAEFAFWLSRFRMHLLFFISGTVSWFMVNKRSAGQFTLLRLRRLFIPLLVGVFVIVPPQVYFERISHGYHGSFWQFYPSTFDFRPYPKGNTSWHHLWFIAYLLVYDIVLAPLFAWATSARGKAFAKRLLFLAKGYWIYLLMAPSVIWFSATILYYPNETNCFVNDYCFVVYWALFVVAGFICMLQPALMDSLERNRRLSLTLAFIFMIGINVLRWNKIEPHFNSSLALHLFLMRHPINAWCWVFALVGYGKKYLNKKLPVLDYLNTAVYPFYILHQTVIVIVAYYVIQTNDEISLKYTFIVVTSFLVSMGIFHLFIRPFGVMRYLFGMKPKAPAPRVVTEKIPEIPVLA